MIGGKKMSVDDMVPLIAIGIFVLYTIYNVVARRQKVIDNWKKERCSPPVMLLAPLYGKPLAPNLEYCVLTPMKIIYEIYIYPIVYIIELFIKMLENIAKNMQNMRRNTNNTRGAFTDIIGGTAKTMSNISAILQYYQSKLTELLKQKMAFISIIGMFVKAVGVTLWVAINGPIPQMVSFLQNWWPLFIVIMIICILCIYFFWTPTYIYFCPICLLCFSKDTDILMPDGSYMSISKLKIGNTIKYGGKVISTFRINVTGKDTVMYNYNGTIVTGSHIVYEDNKPIRVHLSKLAKKIDYTQDYIYCINTEKHLLADKYGNLFSDFHECGDTKTNLMANYEIIRSLNGDNKFKYSPYNIFHTYQWGMSYNTPIKLDDGKYRPLNMIKIGDILDGGNKVYGIVKHHRYNIKSYHYKGIILSGSQIIMEDGIWIRVNESKRFRPYHKRQKYYISLLTENHTINVKGGLILRDYIELDEEHPVFDTIHNLNLNSI